MGKTEKYRRRRTYKRIKRGGNSVGNLKSIIPPMISTLSGGTPQQVANEHVLNMAKEHAELINPGVSQSGGAAGLVVPQMNTGMMPNPQDGNHLAIKGASSLLQTHANSQYDSDLYGKPIQSAGKRSVHRTRKMRKTQKKTSKVHRQQFKRKSKTSRKKSGKSKKRVSHRNRRARRHTRR